MRVLREREANLLPHHLAPDDSLPAAVAQLADEVGEDVARQRLAELEFRPVFTAHPTEARRRAVSGAIRRIAELVAERDLRYTGGMSLAENDRRLLGEIDTLWRTAPLREAKPSVLDEVRTVINVFEATLAEVLPAVYRRLDDWLLADAAGTTAPAVRPFARLGTWIGGDRDGNPNVTAEITAGRRRDRLRARAAGARVRRPARPRAGSPSTPPARPASPRAERPVAAAARLSASLAAADRGRRPQRAAPPGRATSSPSASPRPRTRNADLGYGARRRARGRPRRRAALAGRRRRDARRPTATSSGSSGRCRPSGSTWPSSRCGSTRRCTRRALADLAKNGIDGDLEPRTVEVLDTFRAIGAVQRRLRRSQAAAATSCRSRSPPSTSPPSTSWPSSRSPGLDAPVIDAIPLFETFADLEASRRHPRGAPSRSRRCSAGSRRTAAGVEVMLGYSDSSKDVGPVSATLTLDARAGRDHGVGAPQRHRAHAVPRPRRRARSRRRPREPRAPRPSPRARSTAGSSSPSRARSSSPATATR